MVQYWIHARARPELTAIYRVTIRNDYQALHIVRGFFSPLDGAFPHARTNARLMNCVPHHST
ncbi:MAG: hypothetical protein IRZ28_13445 [Steroidobacteraceae bacterium]|nr:hypothetical protein [Steroidobacteraceae bacterium]